MGKNKIKIDQMVDPDDPSRTKIAEIEKEGRDEKRFDNMESGNDLDIPGSELDDNMENIGSEDEENNYYSLGGDRHHNLEDHED